MAITSLDGLIAGMQPPVDFTKGWRALRSVGRLYSPFYNAGYPGAAVAPTPGIAGAELSPPMRGSLPSTDGGSQRSTLARFRGFCDRAGVLLLCDRLWHNSGILCDHHDRTDHQLGRSAGPWTDTGPSTARASWFGLRSRPRHRAAAPPSTRSSTPTRPARGPGPAHPGSPTRAGSIAGSSTITRWPQGTPGPLHPDLHLDGVDDLRRGAPRHAIGCWRGCPCRR